MAAISEQITFETSDCKKNDAVFLTWKNPLAGYDSWLFSGDRDVSYYVETGEEFLPAGSNVRRFLSKTAWPRLTLRTGGLSEQEAEGVSGLKNAAQVYIETVSGRQYPVTVRSFSEKIYSDTQVLSEIEVVLEFPSVNTQTV